MSKQSQKEAVHKALKSRRWIPGYELTQPDIGGSEGLRRLRELRAEGLNITKRRITNSSAYEYRLAGSR